jgi:hypothetical protein
MPVWAKGTSIGSRALSPDGKFEGEAVGNSVVIREHFKKAVMWSAGHSLVIRGFDFLNAMGFREANRKF